MINVLQMHPAAGQSCIVRVHTCTCESPLLPTHLPGSAAEPLLLNAPFRRLPDCLPCAALPCGRDASHSTKIRSELVSNWNLANIPGKPTC